MSNQDQWVVDAVIFLLGAVFGATLAVVGVL